MSQCTRRPRGLVETEDDVAAAGISEAGDLLSEMTNRWQTALELEALTLRLAKTITFEARD
jgi:hypothetical protein